ncbi:MAG: chromosomal replication initiator protein DnaA [Candidatus Buchananbacteria bacterium]|jgi:chromosomal replication initiator protein
MTPQELWQAALGELEILLSKANFTTWFRNTSIANYNDDKVVINVPNIFTKEYLAKKYHQSILKALRNITQNNNLKDIEYKIDSSTQNRNNFFSNTHTPAPSATIRPAEEAKVSPVESVSSLISQKSIETQHQPPKNFSKSPNKLNIKYTFSTFIVGKNSELAHAAALAVVKNPGNAYNPLFIYGGVGLGKTHLMQAIGNKILENNPEAKVLYISCENFTNDFMNAVRSASENPRALEEFNARYRSLDVFLIDDIQFLSGKERTEEAFFNIFNELQQNGKQLVISSDRPPKAIPGIEQRTISRFEWGMIADISAPDYETKLAIIGEKLKEKDFTLNSEITNYLARAIQNNIRELEGVLNRIMALSQLQNRQLSLEEVKEITASIIINTQKNSLTPKNVIKLVAEYFDIAIEDVVGPCRKKNLTDPRQIIMHIMREELKLSYPAIGQSLGGRDHTTVIHACDKIMRNLKTNDKLRQDINTLRQKLHI